MASVLRFDEWQDSDGNPVASGAGGVFSSPGSILQIVRATDAIERSTTSTSFVDSNLSVAITPQKSDSAIIVLATFNNQVEWTTANFPIGIFRIADSSDNAVGGQSELQTGSNQISMSADAKVLRGQVSMFAYDTPATTSPVTYKLRFRSNAGGVTVKMVNTTVLAQMYAIEVGA